ncbi:hypothetical protein FACS189450_04880 [Spirochaetia bacterium]|nr:hypothetical protein FACS189450_04880 [Spirochaetia bacterium]
MKCRSCGAPLTDDQEKCDYCGATGSLLTGSNISSKPELEFEREFITVAAKGDDSDDKVSEYTRLMNSGKDAWEKGDFGYVYAGGQKEKGFYEHWVSGFPNESSDGAVAYFHHALKILETAEAYCWLANALRDSKMIHKKDGKTCSKGVSKKDGKTYTYTITTMGDCFSYYAEAIKIAPDRAIFYYERALANLKINPDHHRNAIDDLTKAISLSPNNFRFIEKRRWIYLDHGDTEKAKADYKLLLQNPEFTKKRDAAIAKNIAMFKGWAAEKKSNLAALFVTLAGLLIGLLFGIFFGKVHWGILRTILFIAGMAVAGFIGGFVFARPVVAKKAMKKDDSIFFERAKSFFEYEYKEERRLN